MPLIWRGRLGEARCALRWFGVLLVLLSGICALTLCLFLTAYGRYQAEFLPALVVLAVVGIWGLERALAGHQVWRRLARFGWGLLLAGRLGLGRSFRVGCPEEETTLRTDGIFRYTRNPMYVGLDATLLAASLYTLNPLVLIAGIGIAGVHHRIIKAEEECLRKMRGQDYEEYCRKVGRYL